MPDITETKPVTAGSRISLAVAYADRERLRGVLRDLAAAVINDIEKQGSHISIQTEYLARQAIMEHLS